MVPAWVGGAIEEVASNSHHLVYPCTAQSCNCSGVDCNVIVLQCWGKNMRGWVHLRLHLPQPWECVRVERVGPSCEAVHLQVQVQVHQRWSWRSGWGCWRSNQPRDQATSQPCRTTTSFFAPRSSAFPAPGLNCKLFQTLRLPSSQGHQAWDKESALKLSTRFVQMNQIQENSFKRVFWCSHSSAVFALTQGGVLPLRWQHPSQVLRQGGTGCWAHPNNNIIRVKIYIWWMYTSDTLLW